MYEINKLLHMGRRLVTVYRPPPSRRNKLTAAMFFDEFPRLLESTTVHPKPLMICGDFNFRVGDTANSDACNFIDLLESVNMIQHVSTPTHRKGHILDLIIRGTQRGYSLKPLHIAVLNVF